VWSAFLLGCELFYSVVFTSVLCLVRSLELHDWECVGKYYDA
jgi:hypothetical protein